MNDPPFVEAATKSDKLKSLLPWILEGNRDLEIQDACAYSFNLQKLADKDCETLAYLLVSRSKLIIKTLGPIITDMNAIKIQYHQSPCGELILGSFDEGLCLCDWRYRRTRTTIDKRLMQYFGGEYREEESPVIAQARQQLEEYFSGDRQSFDVPLLTAGTEFQKSVWKALREVAYGATSTYLELAHDMGNKAAVRAVASANGANAISIFIPCHRIIGSDGDLVGYAGGLRSKQKLLQLEQAAVQNSEPFALVG